MAEFLLGTNKVRVRDAVAIAKRAARMVAAGIGGLVFRADLAGTLALVRRYRVGMTDFEGVPPAESWGEIILRQPGLRLHRVSPASPGNSLVPFVYERDDAPNLACLRDRYRLREVIGDAGDEYGAMLRLGAWLGTRWDHGVGPVPGGTLACDPVAIIEAGELGAKYWCEIAAKVAVQAATALSWPARLATASRDGQMWEHAVAELWSNSFDKWFVLDTDFNIVYEHHGVPLSSFELCHRGEALRDSGSLHVRGFATPKTSLPMQDLVPFYRYVHIDLRNDWCSRRLPAGSPAGGDRATWWTARPELNLRLTAKKRIDDQSLFDWKVNSTEIHPLNVRRLGATTEVDIGLSGYSPWLRGFEVALDSQKWRPIAGCRANFELGSGKHSIRARLVGRSATGPTASVDLECFSD